MVKADPNLAWLKEAEKRGDVDWRQVREIHDSWKYSSSGLGAAPSLVISIVAAAYLGPVYGAMASNLAIGTINNKGDLGRGLKEAASTDNLKRYAITAATAYLAENYFDDILKTKTNPFTQKVTVDLSSLSGVGRFAANQAMQSVTSTALSKAVGLGGSFSDALKDSLYNTFAAAGFNAIGDFGKTHGLEAGDAQMVVMHAVMGGLAAEARGGSFAAGAAGAGLNEALVGDLDKLISSYSPANREALLTMSSQLVGILGVLVQNNNATADQLETGAWAARNSTQYNYLNHEENQQRFEAKKACDGGDKTACAHFDELNELDRRRDLNLLAACSSKGSSETCSALRKEAWEAAQSLKRASWTPEAQEQYQQAMQNPELMAYTIEGELHSIYKINDPITAGDSKRLAEAMASFGSDFIPGYGDAKAFADAEDPFDYAIAGVGLVPGVGDGAAKILAKAKALYKEGKVAEAADLVEGLDKLPRSKSQNEILGGAHRDTSKPVNDGYDSHHCPAQSCYKGAPISSADGPAIKMDPADHKNTASYGRDADARAYRERQQDLLSQGKLYEAIQMDIDDIRSKFGSKYDESIRQMLEYAKGLNPDDFRKR
jgi:filamentous hemagglutinin